MRINSKSIKEFNGSRNLGSVANMPGRSLGKLSSGYRINRAGDGVAVLILSQNLRVESGDPEHSTCELRGGLPVLQAIGS